ncbi:MAG TPA: ANTAR domain-containing protein [Myxococcota bacterium]|nr:ANTAR domain-containing protein [Myxococcota bacterium]
MPRDRLRIALVDDKPERSDDLERALVAEGYDVIARLTSGDDLRARVGALAPEVIIVDMQSPDRDVLEDMRRLQSEAPRPIVMFVDESDADSIRAAVRAGVSAYVVDGLRSRSVRPIVEVAVARFEAFQALRGELDAARESLEERKQIERAKGILMQRRGVGEAEAWKLLRRAAMDRQTKIAEVARQVIEMAELL